MAYLPGDHRPNDPVGPLTGPEPWTPHRLSANLYGPG